MHSSITVSLIKKHTDKTKGLFDYGRQEFTYLDMNHSVFHTNNDYQNIIEFIKREFLDNNIDSYTLECTDDNYIKYKCFTGPIMSICEIKFNNESIIVNTRLTNVCEEYGFR